MKKQYFIIAIILIFFLLPQLVKAQDLTVDCNLSNVCVKNTSDPLFPSNIFWYPGLTLSRTVRITNNTGLTISAHASGQKLMTSDLDQVLSLSIKTVNNLTIWSGSLADFYDAESIDLGNLANKDSADYIYTVSMNQSANNNYQNKTAGFDLNFNFTSEFVTPTVTPIPVTLGSVIGISGSSSSVITKNSSVSTSSDTDSNLFQEILFKQYVFSNSKYNFAPVLFGLATSSSQLIFNSGQIQGAETQENNNLFWLIVIGAELLLILIYLFIKLKMK